MIPQEEEKFTAEQLQVMKTQDFKYVQMKQHVEEKVSTLPDPPPSLSLSRAHNLEYSILCALASTVGHSLLFLRCFNVDLCLLNGVCAVHTYMCVHQTLPAYNATAVFLFLSLVFSFFPFCTVHRKSIV